MTAIGYARVSTTDQDLTVQIGALSARGENAHSAPSRQPGTLSRPSRRHPRRFREKRVEPGLEQILSAGKGLRTVVPSKAFALAMASADQNSHIFPIIVGPTSLSKIQPTALQDFQESMVPGSSPGSTRFSRNLRRAIVFAAVPWSYSART